MKGITARIWTAISLVMITVFVAQGPAGACDHNHDKIWDGLHDPNAPVFWSWHWDENWDPYSGVPDSGDRVLVDKVYPGYGYEWCGIFSGSAACKSLCVGYAKGGGVMLMDGSLSAVEFEHLGCIDGWSGEIQQTGGTNETPELTLGCGGGSAEGIYSLSGSSSQLNAEVAYIGGDGDGYLTQSGGQFNCDTVYVGHEELSYGEYSLSGGEFDADTLYIGYEGEGEVSQTGGTITVSKDMHLGYSVAGDGSYSIDGGTCDVTGDVCIGDEGTGTVSVVGGVMSVGGDVRMSCANGAESILAIDKDGADQTTLDIDGSLLVGYALDDAGTAELKIEDDDATITIADELRFGKRSKFTVAANQTPTITMDGSASKFTIKAGAGASDLAGLGDLTLEFAGEDWFATKDVEVAGEDDGDLAVDDFTTANFVINELVVGNSQGTVPVILGLVDNEDNKPGGEALYVKTLTLRGSGTFILGYPLYFLKNNVSRLLVCGDSNVDGMVDIVDLTAVSANWSSLPPNEGVDKFWLQGDFNCDWKVDIEDLTCLAANWTYGEGDGPPGGGKEDAEEEGGGGAGKLDSEPNLTISTTSQDTPDLEGYKTFTVTVETDTGVLGGFDLEFDADTMNQVNPYGAYTIFEDYNVFMEEPLQDSQFKFHTTNDDLSTCDCDEDGTHLEAGFAFNGGIDNENAAASVDVAQIVLPKELAATMAGEVVVLDSSTGEQIACIEVDDTINSQE